MTIKQILTKLGKWIPKKDFINSDCWDDSIYNRVTEVENNMIDKFSSIEISKQDLIKILGEE